jgi:GT2 family glycosyltransferase
MAPLDGAGDGPWRSYERRAPDMLEATPGLCRAFYLVAVASDLAVPDLGSSMYSDLAPIDETLGAVPALRRVREDMARDQRALSDLLHERDRLQEQLRCEAQHASVLSMQITAMQISTWWRVGAPLRSASKRFPQLAHVCRRGVRAVSWLLTGQLPERLRQRRAYFKRMAMSQLEAPFSLPFGLDTPCNPSQVLLPPADGAVISIIIPSYGQVDYTLRCLASISAALPRQAIEVIVVDDASGDPHVESLRGISNLRLVVWERNRGFLRSCNEAAQLASGELVMFLNNDTVVLPGTIDALAELLQAQPDIGLAGARLLYPDGRQQEAGGILWRDGSAWNYGHNDDPDRPEYNYVREADYISAAAIMLRRDVWDRLGGFDEHFAPAYCEDSDLAFRLRAAGLRVVYQPEANIVHYEGVSHGTDVTTGLKAHQVTNTVKLFNRWRDTLQREHLPAGERVMRARDRSLRRTVTLVIDHYVPEPDRDAGSRTMLAFMDALLASGRVVKFFPANGCRSPGYTAILQRRGIEVLYNPWSGSFADWIAANGAEIDEVLLSRPHVAETCLAALAQHCRAPVVFYGHDLHHARLRSEPAADRPAGASALADATEALERKVWRSVDVVLYPSEQEAAVARRLEPGIVARSVPAYAFSRPVAVRTQPPPAEAGVIFVAGFAHPPNIDAAKWLVAEILPRIRAVYPKLPLTLVGSHPAKSVSALAADGIVVTGFVSDEELDRHYATARVAVCPLRFGAGVKLKVVEAMHRGLPLVTTPIGAQGLEGIEAVCDVAADPDAFAAAVVRLLRDDALWLERAAAQGDFVASRYSPDKVRESLVAAFDEARQSRGATASGRFAVAAQ